MAHFFSYFSKRDSFLYLSNSVKHFSNATVKSSSVKPLVILLPWMGATQSSISKYAQVYTDVGCSVVVRHTYPPDFLWPKLGLKNSKKFLFEIKDIMASNDQPILIHSISIGCYFYALMLMNFQEEPHNFNKVSQNIRLQVVDSPVVGTLREMAHGLAVHSSSNKAFVTLLQTSLLIYFALSKAFTVKIYNQSINAMKFTPCLVPSLILSNISDPLAVSASLNDFIKSWEDLGIDLTTKIWDNSVHAQHLKLHPSLYKELIYNLLDKTIKDGIILPSKL